MARSKESSTENAPTLLDKPVTAIGEDAHDHGATGNARVIVLYTQVDKLRSHLHMLVRVESKAASVREKGKGALARGPRVRRLRDVVIVKVVATATGKQAASSTSQKARDSIEAVDSADLAEEMAVGDEVDDRFTVRIPLRNNGARRVRSGALAVRFLPVAAATVELSTGAER